MLLIKPLSEGGWNGEEIESTCEKYYPERDEWVEISEVFHTAFLLLAEILFFYYLLIFTTRLIHTSPREMSGLRCAFYLFSASVPALPHDRRCSGWALVCRRRLSGSKKH
jgi:hypothetical protein